MKNAGFIKRILVVIYDGLLLTGVVLVGYFPIFAGMQLLPESVANGQLGAALKFIYLLGITFYFYGWFWTHGGQTLGMRAWHLYLINSQGKFPSWRVAAVRYLAALCSWGLLAGALYAAGIKFWYLSIGLGFSWMLLNSARLSWHDILSNTRIVIVPPKQD